MDKLKYKLPFDFTKQDDSIDELIICTGTKKLITIVALFYSVDNKKAAEIIDDYKERYKFDLCSYCEKYAVTSFYSNSGMDFIPDDTNGKWDNGEGVEFDSEPLDDFGESMQAISLTAEICLNCDELIKVEAQKN